VNPDRLWRAPRQVKARLLRRHQQVIDDLRRAVRHHVAIPLRQESIHRLEATFLNQLLGVEVARKLGRSAPPIALLASLRPLLSLVPLDQQVLGAARRLLSELNAEALLALQKNLAGGAPVLAIVSCQAQLARSQATLADFAAWTAAGWGQPLIVIGDPRLPDWRFEFCPERRLLRLPADDAYEGLPAKLITLQWVLSLLPSPPALLKMDDDAQPDDPLALAQLVETLGVAGAAAAGFPIFTPSPLHLDRAWHIGKSARSNLRPFNSLGATRWMSGGTGYLLNGQAVSLLGDFALHSWGFVESMLYEDVCVSMLLQAGAAQLHWLNTPEQLGIRSERQQEIEAGQWQVPDHLR
jgi:hypothetical protein